MIIGKKKMKILGLNEINLICLKSSVYAQDKLSKKEDLLK